jgi:hypothetical protein
MFVDTYPFPVFNPSLVQPLSLSLSLLVFNCHLLLKLNVIRWLVLDLDHDTVRIWKNWGSSLADCFPSWKPYQMRNVFCGFCKQLTYVDKESILS